MTTSLLERFLRYVKIDTTSDPSSPATPSTEGQWVLARILADELRDLGVPHVELTEHGYVIGRIPASSPDTEHAPVVALFSHLDTALDAPGANVTPKVHGGYDGKPILLREDPRVILDPAEDLPLARAIGETIITTDGTTLLGADDKAGIAVIMTVVERLMRDGSIPHGPLRIVFNPDEEIARGVVKLSLSELGADLAYTLDGDEPESINFETFSANRAEIVIHGRPEHPGSARGRMINALILAAKLLSLFPRENLAPESTDGRMGFIHPTSFSGTTERATISVILRDFEESKLEALGQMLTTFCQAVEASAPGSTITCEITPQYRNMRDTLRKDMRPVEFVREVMAKRGLTPDETPVRGGTDGSDLTARGLPTPNLGRGGHNPHSVREWVSLEEMEESVEIVLGVLERWATEAR
jgi:tripeptide aminopeptidase